MQYLILQLLITSKLELKRIFILIIIFKKFFILLYLYLRPLKINFSYVLFT